MKRRRTHNPKKRMRGIPATETERAQLQEIARQVRYVGNPDHKCNPGDYGLEPPSRPRMGKSLCDVLGTLLRVEAQDLLQQSIEQGCVSEREENGFPRIVWAIHNDIV